MLKINEVVAAKGTAEKLEEVIEGFKKGKIQVFKGNYIGINVDDPDDIYDLSGGYR